MRAAVKSMELFLDSGVEARRLELKGAKDPDEYIQKFGAPAFEEILARAEPLVEVVIRRTVEKEGPSPEGRVRAMDALLPVLRKLPDVVQMQMVSRAAGWLNLPEDEIRSRLGEAPKVLPATPPPSRWLPTKELSHLLWLVIHFPTQVADVVMSTDPHWITDRESLLNAIGQLCQNTPLPDVLESMPDDDTSTVLRKIAAQPSIYEEKQAAGAARAILANMELIHVEAKISSINVKISGATNSGDTSSTTALAREIATLYARRVALRSLASRRA